jgi:UDP-N-acetylglucosamine 1-carboxyvinyltransferase
MAACLLTDETLRLGNLPHVADITTMANLLAQLGVRSISTAMRRTAGMTGACSS